MAELSSTYFGIVMLACFVAFIAVTVTIYDARRVCGSVDNCPSAIGWILSTVFGFFFWVFLVFAMSGFGMSHSGDPGILITPVFLGGPTLYLYSAYRWYQSAVVAKRAAGGQTSEP